jgi:hypothetical protein
MIRIDRIAVQSNFFGKARLLYLLHDTIMATRAQRLQRAQSKLGDVIAMRDDVMHSHCWFLLSQREAPFAQRMLTPIRASHLPPMIFIVQPCHGRAKPISISRSSDKLAVIPSGLWWLHRH